MYLEWISQTQYRIQLFTILWGSDFLMFSWRNAVETPRNELSILWQYAWNIRYFFVLWFFFLQYVYLYRQESQVKNTRAPKNVWSVHSLQNSVDKLSWDTSLFCLILPLSEFSIPKLLSVKQRTINNTTPLHVVMVSLSLKVVIPYLYNSPYNTTGSCHQIIHETFDSYHCAPSTWILHFSHTHVFWFWALDVPFFL